MSEKKRYLSGDEIADAIRGEVNKPEVPKRRYLSGKEIAAILRQTHNPQERKLEDGGSKRDV